MIGGGKLQPDPEKVKAVKDWPEPLTKKHFRAFLGLVGYYRRFIPQFSTVAAPPTDLTRKGQPEKVQFTESCRDAFETLKGLLLHAPILHVADPGKPFILQTDASDRGLGSVLSQKDEKGDEHPVAYASRKLFPREINYSVIEKECLAIVWALRYFNTYLYGHCADRPSTVAWLQKMKNTNHRLTRWALSIQPYRVTVQHRKGCSNGNADGLSRVTNGL